MKCISVTKFLKYFPEYHQLHAHQKWQIDTVGHAYDYDESVHNYDLYAFHGVFMELFIRKYLCRKFGIHCRDDRTEKLLQQNQFSSYSIQQDVANAYHAYTDPQCDALNIIEEIKIVGLSQRLSHGEHMEDFSSILSMEVNMDNLQDVMHYLDKTPYTNMIYKEPSDLQFGNYNLRGVPDYIFDSKIFCQITTSMHDEVPMDKLAQVVFYILGYYDCWHYSYYDTVKDFVIQMYNPLLGKTYTTNLKLTPKEFERMKGCVEKSINIMIQNGWCY